jgi:hypothetical protein
VLVCLLAHANNNSYIKSRDLTSAGEPRLLDLETETARVFCKTCLMDPRAETRISWTKSPPSIYHYLYMCHSDTHTSFIEHKNYAFSVRTYTCKTCYEFSKEKGKRKTGAEKGRQGRHKYLQSEKING